MERSEQIAQIHAEFMDIRRVLNEKSIRWWCASKARAYNRIYSKGGVSIVSKATGISRPRIYRGLQEIKLGDSKNQTNRLRSQGGGRKKNNSNPNDPLSGFR